MSNDRYRTHSNLPTQGCETMIFLFTGALIAALPAILSNQKGLAITTGAVNLFIPGKDSIVHSHHADSIHKWNVLFLVVSL